MDTNKTPQNSIEPNRNRILSLVLLQMKKNLVNIMNGEKNWLRIGKKLTQPKASHMEENLVPEQTS